MITFLPDSTVLNIIFFNFMHGHDQTQFLHCLHADTIGGENEFADGFKIEREMRFEHHQEWEILSKTLVEFGDIGNDEFGMFYKAKYCQHFR